MGRLLKFFIMAVLAAAALSGCVEKNILDDISLVNGIGFDYYDETKIRGTVIYPYYLPEKDPEDKTFTAVSEINKTILDDIGRQTADPVVTGSLNIILFGEELAERKGILELVDAFQRDPGVGSTLYLAVVEGTAREFLEENYRYRSTAELVSRIIQHNIDRGDLPKTNLQRFLFDYYQRGKTPFMPRLKRKPGKIVDLDGINLFCKGKIADYLPPDKMFFFKLLVDEYSEGLYLVEIDEGKASVRSIRSKRKFRLMEKDPYKIRVEIDVNGVIDEFTGNELKPATMKKLEHEFENMIKEECTKLIRRFKEKEVDPAGFGHFVKTKIRNFDIEKWRNTDYKDLKVEIKPTVKITQSGVIE